MARAKPAPGEVLLSSPVLASVGLFALNDHFLKATYGNWWTGKLSDFAGLFFFPLALAGAFEWLWFWMGRREDFHLSRSLLWSLFFLTGVVFSVINLSTTAASGYEAALGQVWTCFGMISSAGAPRIAHTLDPTDLIALPMLGLSLLWHEKVFRKHRRG